MADADARPKSPGLNDFVEELPDLPTAISETFAESEPPNLQHPQSTASLECRTAPTPQANGPDQVNSIDPLLLQSSLPGTYRNCPIDLSTTPKARISINRNYSAWTLSPLPVAKTNPRPLSKDGNDILPPTSRATVQSAAPHCSSAQLPMPPWPTLIVTPPSGPPQAPPRNCMVMCYGGKDPMLRVVQPHLIRSPLQHYATRYPRQPLLPLPSYADVEDLALECQELAVCKPKSGGLAAGNSARTAPRSLTHLAPPGTPSRTAPSFTQVQAKRKEVRQKRQRPYTLADSESSESEEMEGQKQGQQGGSLRLRLHRQDKGPTRRSHNSGSNTTGPDYIPRGQRKRTRR